MKITYVERAPGPMHLPQSPPLLEICMRNHIVI